MIAARSREGEKAPRRSTEGGDDGARSMLLLAMAVARALSTGQVEMCGLCLQGGR
jgi:hypothetical protein